MASKLKFSFVMPVYNVERYIAEAIESIIRQTIGFKDSCEIIIVNDGSTDRSESVCIKYRDKYPHNVRYIKQENKGVSAARNRGLKEASGRYIGFLDPDDKLSKDTLREVFRFFEKHYDEIDLCSIKMEYFGAKHGPHMTSSRFTKDRIVRVDREWSSVQTAIGSSFIKRRAIIDNLHEFDTRLSTIEDGKFINHIILDKMAYGVVCKPTHYYRRRHSGDSAMASRWRDKSWYTDTPKYAFIETFEYAKRKLGYIPKYIQFFSMYHLQWSVKARSFSGLGSDETYQYKKVFKNILQHIDEDVIVAQKEITVDQKVYCVSIKNNTSIKDTVYYSDEGYLRAAGVNIQKVRNTNINIDFIYIKDNRLVIEGYHNGYRQDGLSLGFRSNKKLTTVSYTERPYLERKSFDEIIYRRHSFIVEINLSDITELIPVFIIKDKEYNARRLQFERFSGLNSRSHRSYKVLGSSIIAYDKTKLNITQYSRKRHAKFELKLAISLAREGVYSVVFTRALYWLAHPFYAKKRIWLLSDRSYTAGDNADHLFQYIAQHKTGNVVPYFALQKTHPRFKRLKSFGAVVHFGGLRYKILSLFAEKRISSMFDKYITSPFGDNWMYYSDLLDFDSIYLQHGVLSSDSSEKLNRWKNNFRLITVATDQERQAFLQKNYGYSEDVVRMSGQARFDPLMRSSRLERVIIFMPTWRNSIAGVAEMRDGAAAGFRHYNPYFKGSEYFKFYNSVLTDKRLISALSEHDYSLEFYVHPSFSSQWRDFTASENVKIMTPPHDYVDAMQRGSLMVTDYSGVQFDFAYMKKPIIYTQYDKDSLYDYHYYKKGYFSYEDDGFGPVTTDLEGAVSSIVTYIERGCRIDDVYRARVDTFFYKIDDLNASRIYRQLIGMV